MAGMSTKSTPCFLMLLSRFVSSHSNRTSRLYCQIGNTSNLELQSLTRRLRSAPSGETKDPVQRLPPKPSTIRIELVDYCPFNFFNSSVVCLRTLGSVEILRTVSRSFIASPLRPKDS